MASTSETPPPVEPTLPFTVASPPPAVLDEPAVVPVAAGVELEPVLLSATPGVGGQASVLQACCEAPAQAAPPLDGEGFVQVRVCVPAPHETVHSDHEDQPPAITGGSGAAQLVMFQNCCVAVQSPSSEPDSEPVLHWLEEAHHPQPCPRYAKQAAHAPAVLETG